MSVRPSFLALPLGTGLALLLGCQAYLPVSAAQWGDWCAETRLETDRWRSGTTGWLRFRVPPGFRRDTSPLAGIEFYHSGERWEREGREFYWSSGVRGFPDPMPGEPPPSCWPRLDDDLVLHIAAGSDGEASAWYAIRGSHRRGFLHLSGFPVDEWVTVLAILRSLRIEPFQD